MVTAKALSGLMKFCGRDTWAPLFEEVLDEHFGVLDQAFDLAFEDLDDELGEGTGMTLWGCAFEDFLARRFEPDGRNVVDDYLKRRGFKEPARNKAYMKALRDSVMSLYEASDVRPGESLLMRDLLRGGEPIRVHEKSGTRMIKPWDRLAARIVPEGDGYAMGGGLLPMSQGACDVLFTALKLSGSEDIEQSVQALADEIEQGPSEQSLSDLGFLADIVFDDEQLAALPSLVTMAWLTAAMKRLDAPSRPLVNAEGDPILAHDLRFPLAEGVRNAEIAERLDSQDAFEAASDTFWNWWTEAPTSGGSVSMPADALMLQTTLDDGRPVLGTIELESAHLLLSVNSAKRAERGRAMLEALLGDRIGAPEIVIRTPDASGADPETGRTGTDADLPEGVTPEMLFSVLDAHYREVIDKPLNVLGGVSPRALAKTEKGRPRVVDWLKSIENSSAHAGMTNVVLARYDTAWLWDELGLAEERR